MSDQAGEHARDTLRALQQAAETMLAAVTDASFVIGTILQDPRNLAKRTDEELADVGFFFRETENLLDEARKECGRKKELVGKVLALRLTRKAINSDDPADLRVETEVCSATPDVKMRPNLPHKHSEKWFSLMAAFGVTREAAERGVVSFHWQRISEWLTELAARGEAPPVELELMKPEKTVTYRKRRTKK